MPPFLSRTEWFFKITFTVMVFVMVSISIIFFATPAHAFDGIITYQGKLSDSTGTTVSDGDYSIKFSIYDASTGGSCQYTASGTCGTPTAVTVTVTGGIFSVNLGDGSDTNTIDPTIFQSNNLFLGVTVASDSEMTPRKQLNNVGFAYNALYLSGLATSTAGGTGAYIPAALSNGDFVFTGTPTSTEVAGGVLYINPASATADYTLLGLAVGGTEKFRVDEDGDVFASGTMYTGDLTVSGTCTGCGGGGITDNGGTITLDDTSDDLAFGTSTAVGKLTIVPDSGQPALSIHATGTSGHLTQWVNSASSSLLAWVDSGGAFYGSSTLDISGDTSLFNNVYINENQDMAYDDHALLINTKQGLGNNREASVIIHAMDENGQDLNMGESQLVIMDQRSNGKALFIGMDDDGVTLDDAGLGQFISGSWSAGVSDLYVAGGWVELEGTSNSSQHNLTDTSSTAAVRIDNEDDASKSPILALSSDDATRLFIYGTDTAEVLYKSEVLDQAGAGAFVFDTARGLTVAENRSLLMVRQQGEEKFSIDGNGNTYTSGTMYASTMLPDAIGSAGTDLVTVNASTTFANNAGIDGEFYIGTNNSNSLRVHSTSSFESALTAEGDVVIGTNSGNNLVVHSSSTFESDIQFDERVIIGDNSAGDSLLIYSTTSVRDQVSFNSHVTLGDGSGDNITFNGIARFGQNLLPKATASTDLGSQSLSFQGLYASGAAHLGGATNGGASGLPVVRIQNGAQNGVAIATSTIFGGGYMNYGLILGDGYESYFGGNMIIGDTFTASSQDTLTVNATSTFNAGITLNSEVSLGTHNTYDIGAVNNALDDIYASGTFFGGPGYFSALTVTNNQVFSAEGAVILGSSDGGDGITIQGVITSDVIPNGTRDLGEPGNAWTELYTSGTAHIGHGSTGNAPIIIADTTGGGFVGISSTTLNTTAEGAKLQVAGGIFVNGTLTVDTTDAMAGNAIFFSSAGSLVSQPTNSDGTSAFGFAVTGTDIDQGNLVSFSTTTEDGSVNRTLLEIGYAIDPSGNFTTTTFFSGIQDAEGATAFHFDTENSITSSTDALDRTLLTVSNGGTPKFHVGAGGNVYAKNSFIANSTDFGIGDLAEYVDLAPGQFVESGDVVMPDPEHEGKFKKVDEAYSSSAAGIISNTAAFVMGARGENRAALALAGLVNTNVSDENGAIKVGDMLVTASEPGYLMKYDSSLAIGINAIVVATALESHDEGMGNIKTLVRAGMMTSSTTLSIGENSDGSLSSPSSSDMLATAITSTRGTWAIDQDGKISVKRITSEEYVVEQNLNAPTIGEGVIETGNDSLKVITPAIQDNSKVFVSFLTNLAGRSYHISEKIPGESFTIMLSSPVSEYTLLDWWIVQKEGVETEIEAAQAPPIPFGEPAQAAETPEEIISEEPIPTFEELEQEAQEEVIEDVTEEVVEETVVDVEEAVIEEEIIEQEEETNPVSSLEENEETAEEEVVEEVFEEVIEEAEEAEEQTAQEILEEIIEEETQEEVTPVEEVVEEIIEEEEVI